MKRLLALSLALLLCLSLCACSTIDKVEKELQGTWRFAGSSGGIYIFDDGDFSCETIISGLSLGVREGTYEVTEDCIELHYDNGVDAELDYDYSGGVLSVEELIKD